METQAQEDGHSHARKNYDQDITKIDEPESQVQNVTKKGVRYVPQSKTIIEEKMLGDKYKQTTLMKKAQKSAGKCMDLKD